MAKQIKYITLLLLLLLPRAASAQELEYALELGGMVGTNFYLGDANYSSFFKQQQPAAAIMARYNINPRQSLKFDIGFTKIAGNLQQDNKFPDLPADYSFKNSLIDISAQYELSFFAYGTGSGFKGQRPLTPYIQFGLGTTVCNSVFTANIPIGIGVKYKFRPRWNIGLDLKAHLTLSDKLDGISDPYNIRSDTFKNKDSYCLTTLYISYDLCPKYRKCNND